MSKFVTLKLLNSNERPRQPVIDVDYDDNHDEEGTGEDDGLASATPNTALTTTVVPWKPITINVDSIRNFYPRKNGAQGCRVLLKTGVAYVVADEHADILALIG